MINLLAISQTILPNLNRVKLTPDTIGVKSLDTEKKNNDGLSLVTKDNIKDINKHWDKLGF